MRTVINWKVFLVLVIACLGGILAIFPYVLTVEKNILQSIPIPLQLFILIQIVQSTVLFSFAIFIGLLLAKKVGFSLPLLEAVSGRKDYLHVLKSIIPVSLLYGSLSGFAIILLDLLFIRSGETLGENSISIPLWQRFLASFYGGINEEVLLRLFLMTFFVWISFKVKKSLQGGPTGAGIWLSIIVSSLLFALGHLPITATLTVLTPLVVSRAILLNGIGGIVFGWLYWRKGLESAMFAHFVTDLFIQILFPLLLAGMI